MSGGSQSPVSATVLAERARIVSRVFDHAGEMADTGMHAIMAQIPAYAARDEALRADVHDQLTRLCRTGLGALLDKRRVTVADVAYTRRAAARRAQAGLTLVDYINAFRLGQQALWKTLMVHAGDTEAGREAALSMVTPLTRYCDLISTQAANAYLEFQQYLSAEASREHLELMDSLLAGELPGRGPLLAMAHAHGIGMEADTPVVVVAGSILDSAGALETDTWHTVAAALSRSGIHGHRPLTVVRGAEVVAIAALGRFGTAEEFCERLRHTRESLAAQSISTALGVSTVATDAGQLPKAYQQARAALELLPDTGGVMALPQLTPFRYLVLRADDTARALVDARISTALADDRARGGALAETIRAFAAADMNLRAAAEQLRVHHNTAKYRLRRIQELTGRNVRAVGDLVELLVAIELQETRRG
ncbi:PucR family transcriptional regulator [Nocardia yamanashiensis]|uniref:PucR family transcriptional regulator n=1 Tax=Nocardia yamanashiensis TaxID=209247 RepID=UPI000829DBC3|nr:helix-turn-helix domain-containing protein [Nocardia yamanashiensis]